MATVNKLKSGKWCAQIRSHNKYISKTFLSKGNATKWAKEIEYQLDRDQYEDFSDSARISLGDLITRYRDEITPISFGIFFKIVIEGIECQTLKDKKVSSQLHLWFLFCPPLIIAFLVSLLKFFHYYLVGLIVVIMWLFYREN